MIRYSILLLLCCVAMLTQLTACEEIGDSSDIPYTPHLVVYGVLYTGDTASSIRITRTLPVSERFVDENTWVTDATATITVDGVAYPLVYRDSGYYTIRGITIATGKSYRLDVSWNGLRTSGETIVPPMSPIDTGRGVVSVDPHGYVEATVWLYTHVAQPVALLGSYEVKRPMDAYDSIRALYDSTYRPDTAWYRYGVSYGAIRMAEVGVQDSVGVSVYSNLSTAERYRAVLLTYDPGFYEFARTYDRYYDNDSPFGSGGVNPRWNLDRDGIGLFTGVAVTTREITLR